MKRSFAGVLISFATIALVVSVGAVRVSAKPKKAAAAATASGGSQNPANACGCYSNSQGACFCAKKAKCGCPGECEPKGCEEKRDKEIEKQIAAETKKAASAEKKQRKGGDDTDKAEAKPRPKKP
jgi:hypothetical protein